MRLAVALLLAAVFALTGCHTAAPPAVYSGAFTTGRGEFVVCGDTRPWIFGEFWRAPQGDERRAVIARLAEERPDFVLNTGDLVAFGSDTASWEGFDAEMAPLRDAGVAYLPVLGNHDLFPDAAGGLANWFARFPWLHERRWYDVRYGYVALLVLDTNTVALSPQEIAAQDAWYAAKLAEADADPSVRCVMVTCHQPPITNSYVHGGSPWVTEHVVNPARTHPKVRAVISGHVHSYEHFLDGGTHFIVSGGGGAPLMDVAGPSGEHRDLYDGPRGHHFCRVIPRDDRVDVEMVRMDDEGRWTVADRWTIDLR